MRRHLQPFLFTAFLVGLVSLAYGLNFMYFSDAEVTHFGDRIKFMYLDTLQGPVRSNEPIAIMQNPVFYDVVITSGPDFWRGTGYNPSIPTGNAIFDAPELALPTEATWIRQQAIEQGNYYSAGDAMWARVELRGDTFRLWWTLQSMPLDSDAFEEVPLAASSVLFFDCPELRLFGALDVELILGVSGRATLEDNVLYASSDPITGQPAPNHPEKLALVAEGEIKILNTDTNGRENSDGLGHNQTDPRRTSIALNGVFVALNESFTFEQQNDPDSGYVCVCYPDERGKLYLWGSVMQSRRGYTHRSTRSGTGYLRHHRYDEQIRHWDLHLFAAPENVIEPAALDLGDAAVGDTLRQTFTVTNGFVPILLEDLETRPPFFAELASSTPPRQPREWQKQVTVGFVPTEEGTFFDEVRFMVPGYSEAFRVPVAGSATTSEVNSDFIPHPSAFSLSTAPNPFNARTVLSFDLPEAGPVRVELFDVAGRSAGVLDNGHYAPGSYRLAVDGRALSTGIYFARLTTPHHHQTIKLALIK